MTIELANDYLGCLATDNALDQAGYETWPARSAVAAMVSSSLCAGKTWCPLTAGAALRPVRMFASSSTHRMRATAIPPSQVDIRRSDIIRSHTAYVKPGVRSRRGPGSPPLLAGACAGGVATPTSKLPPPTR